MENTFNNEMVLCNINCFKDINNLDIAKNMVSNILSGIGERVTNDFELILTVDNLYIKAINLSTWGGIPDIKYIEKFSKTDIKLFNVEIVDSNEKIEIITPKNKKLAFIRDNHNKDNLASEMAIMIGKTNL